MHYLQCSLVTNSSISLPALLRRSFLWFCLLIPILCLSFLVIISYSPSYIPFCKNPAPSVSVPGNGNISTSIMSVPLHVQWRLWCGAGEGLSSWDFFSIGLRCHHPWLQSSHVGTFLHLLQRKWEVRLAEVALVLLREKWKSHPPLLKTWKRGVGIRENRVGTMYPVHFRRLNRSVKSSY